MEQEYAVYKGENLLAIGTADECAEKLGIKPDTIKWLTMPVAKRRLATRKKPESCTVVIKLDDSEE